MKLIKKRKQVKKKVFIHIGFMKTGTSAFQAFLNNEKNKKFLIENDIYYPNINRKAQNYLAFSLMDTIPPKVQHILPIGRDELYKTLVDEIKNSKQKNILISSESLSLITTSYFLGHETPERLYQLLIDENIEFKIIVFIRRQDEYLSSLYNQIIKRHNFNSLYNKDINSYFLENIELFDYKTIIDNWAIVFGKNNLIVRVYKKGENSVANIFKAINANIEMKEIENDIINEKISNKTLEFLRIANKFEIDKSNGQQNDLLINMAEEVFSKENKFTSMLTFENSKKIMNDFFEKNKLFSLSYLEDDLSWCDPETIGYGIDYNDNFKISTEEVIEVTTKIWNHFQKAKK